jgi:hypothetical protein
VNNTFFFFSLSLSLIIIGCLRWWGVCVVAPVLLRVVVYVVSITRPFSLLLEEKQRPRKKEEEALRDEFCE